MSYLILLSYGIVLLLVLQPLMMVLRPFRLLTRA